MKSTTLLKQDPDNLNPSNTLEIGEKIKWLRMTQKRTLQEIADQCGLSKSMISKIENDRTIPSVATLVKIATALGTTIAGLLEQESWDKAIMTSMATALEKSVQTEKGYLIFPYASGFHSKKMQPFLFTARQGEVVPHQLSHEGEEFIFIIKGRLKMQVGEVEYLLDTGDSLYFNASLKHGIVPLTAEVVYIDIFS